MRYVVIGAACFILGLATIMAIMAIKAVNEAAVFMDDSFRWGNGRDY